MLDNNKLLLKAIDERELLRDELLFSETEELRKLREEIPEGKKDYYFLWDYLSKCNRNKTLRELLEEKQPHVNYNNLLQYYTELQKIDHPEMQKEYQIILIHIPELEKHAITYELF